MLDAAIGFSLYIVNLFTKAVAYSDMS